MSFDYVTIIYCTITPHNFNDHMQHLYFTIDMIPYYRSLELICPKPQPMTVIRGKAFSLCECHCLAFSDPKTEL